MLYLEPSRTARGTEQFVARDTAFPGEELVTTKSRYFWPVLFILFATDCTTKELVVEHLGIASTTRSGLGRYLGITPMYNPGTAFGFDVRPYLGAWSRPVLAAGMLCMLAILFYMYRKAAPQGRTVALALGLACGGAVGNIVSRLRYPLGVVDFIGVDLGPLRSWAFNVADAGITVGALLLFATAVSKPIAGSSRSEVPERR